MQQLKFNLLFYFTNMENNYCKEIALHDFVWYDGHTVKPHILIHSQKPTHFCCDIDGYKKSLLCRDYKVGRSSIHIEFWKKKAKSDP